VGFSFLFCIKTKGTPILLLGGNRQMDKAIFTEDMTVDEFKAKVMELDSPEKREEAAVSLMNVLGAKLGSKWRCSNLVDCRLG
jgi:hypothetical protein